MGKFMNGVTAGAIIGATIGVMVIPQLDRSTRKRLERTGRRAINIAGDLYENVMRMQR